MDKYSILNRTKFWDVINYLIAQEDEFEIYHLIDFFQIPKWELITYFNFLSEIGHEHQVKFESGKYKYIPSLEPLRFASALSLIESFDLDHLKIQNTDKQLMMALAKLTYILEKSKPSFSDPKKEYFQKICKLQEAIFENQILKLEFEEHSETVLPLKLIILNNQLEFIGEVEESIINLPINIIHQYSNSNHHFNSSFTYKEIDDFIGELCNMEKSKMRLILKALSPFKFPLRVKNIDLESPCEFKTSTGDIIWAATVEPNHEVYEWLAELGPNVQILDPSHFKIEFIRYCEHKLKKLA